MALFDDRLIEMLRKKTEEVKARGIKEKEYECNICKDKGIITKESEDGYSYARDCSCKRTRRWKKKNESNGMSTRLDTNSFDTFIADDKSLKNAKEKAMRYSKNWEGKSFLLCGSVGSGKTHLALAIINEVARGEINSNSVYQVLPDIVFYSHMIGQLKSSMSFSNNQDTTKILNSYKNSPFLMIDDFLKLERSTTVLAWLFDIINHRYMNKLPTVITTELTTTQLMGVDEALASRIIEMCGANNIAIIESTNKRNPNLTGYLQE